MNIYQNCKLMKHLKYLDGKRTSLFPAGQLYCAAELNCGYVHCFVNTAGPSSSPLPQDVGSEIRRYQSADVSSQFDGTQEIVQELQAALLMVQLVVDPWTCPLQKRCWSKALLRKSNIFTHRRYQNILMIYLEPSLSHFTSATFPLRWIKLLLKLLLCSSRPKKPRGQTQIQLFLKKKLNE